VAHNDAAERPREKPDGERGERGQRSGDLGHLREELRRKDRGGRRSVDKEVVPLDRRPDGAGHRDAMGIGRMPHLIGERLHGTRE
jgi:hypothetical protein